METTCAQEYVLPKANTTLALVPDKGKYKGKYKRSTGYKISAGQHTNTYERTSRHSEVNIYTNTDQDDYS